MICPQCRNENDDEYVFCVNCGASIPGAPSQATEYASVATVVGAQRFDSEPPPTISFESSAKADRDDSIRPPFGSVPKAANGRLMLIVAIAAFLIVVIGGVIAAAVYFNRPVEQKAALPGHLGMFLVDTTRNTLIEIPKREFDNVKDGRDAIVKESIAFLEGAPREFILYADATEIKIDDLKLVRIDSINDSGTMRNLDFQASLIDEKPAMKRLRFPNTLANGKYAFVLFNGAFDEGKHKFWAFEVTGSNSSDPNAGRELSVALKEKAPSETPKPPSNSATNTNTPVKPVAEAPIGARVAYCNSSDVVVRAAPSLTARKVNGLRRGQKVFLLSYSDNYDYWNGIRSNWAYIQTEKGNRGWVFTPFISY